MMSKKKQIQLYRVQIKISLNDHTVRAIVNHVISRLIAIPIGDLLTTDFPPKGLHVYPSKKSIHVHLPI